ncbi:hypothetical protein GCM10009076_20470 [Erythrobacter ramosus]
MITGRLGELVDAFLAHFGPFAGADNFADLGGQFLRVHGGSSSHFAGEIPCPPCLSVGGFMAQHKGERNALIYAATAPPILAAMACLRETLRSSNPRAESIRAQ